MIHTTNGTIMKLRNGKIVHRKFGPDNVIHRLNDDRSTKKFLKVFVLKFMEGKISTLDDMEKDLKKEHQDIKIIDNYGDWGAVYKTSRGGVFSYLGTSVILKTEVGGIELIGMQKISDYVLVTLKITPSKIIDDGDNYYDNIKINGFENNVSSNEVILVNVYIHTFYEINIDNYKKIEAMMHKINANHKSLFIVKKFDFKCPQRELMDAHFRGRGLNLVPLTTLT